MLLADLHLVLKVAEFHSITKAATHLDMQTATASAAVKRVEAALGVELFIRTTRQLKLSAAGERYLPNLMQALDMLERAKQNVTDDLDVIEGELRLAISSDLGRNIVIPWLDEFITRHEDVRLKVNLSDSNIDFYRDPIDLALRYGSPTDANLYGFKICNVPRVLCASEEYVKNHTMPNHPQALSSHNGLFYQLHDMVHDVWQFHRGAETFKIKMSGNRAANDGDLVRRWCVAGKGIAAKSVLDVSSDLLAGRLVTLLPEFKPVSTELWLVCPSRQSITPAVRLLRDALKQKCATLLQQLADQHFIDADDM